MAAIAGGATCLCTITMPTPAIGADGQSSENGVEVYHSYEAMTEEIESFVRSHRDAVRVQSIGESLEGRDLWALTIALDGVVEREKRPAMLIVAGLDGHHLVGSAVSIHVAKQLVEKAEAGDEAARSFLTRHTLYVVPRMNPDGCEKYFANVKYEHVRNLRPDDADRDRVRDEDPPNDLNGDGVISMMRVFDPKEADMIADPADPRINVTPDPMKGEHPQFTLHIEGVDDDEDGHYNEDVVGGVDLNMNFMHGYPAHEDGAGLHPVSEPESLALVAYVLEHQNIATAITYGRHDNLSNTPDGKGTYAPGTPRNILEDDVALYQFVGERFREITGLTSAPREEAHGAFHAWAYAQFGVLSFATPLWTGPSKQSTTERSRDGDAGGADEAETSQYTPSGIGDIAQETLDELLEEAARRDFEITEEMKEQATPEMIEQAAAGWGIEVKRVRTQDEASAESPAAESGPTEEADEGDEGEAPKPRDENEARWLAYSDEERNGEGFIDWQEVEHPTLGTVQIGGWAPYFKMNPPAGEVPDIAAKQVEFVLDLAGRFPRVQLSEPTITRLGTDLYQIEVAVVNDGFFPTGTAMSVRNRRARPYVVRLSTPIEQIVSGMRILKYWKIDGSGGREDIRWIVHAPEGSTHTMTVYSEKYGEFEHEITLTTSE